MRATISIRIFAASNNRLLCIKRNTFLRNCSHSWNVLYLIESFKRRMEQVCKVIYMRELTACNDVCTTCKINL